MELAPGTVFAGDYRIERPLSAGGMGAVYLATQLSTGKPRALKLMHRELVFDPASRQHFEQEARIGARIASEHVVEVQAAGVDPATQLPFLVMELLEGEDMATRLRRGPFTLVEAATIFEQLCHALGAAHDAGVVHRDLKPENVFLAVPKRTGISLMVKILDFGIAKVTEGQTHTTGAFGTPLWLAPEQTERGTITPAADVWAMGLLAFAMLTGHLFWRAGEGPEASVTQLIRELVFDPIPLASVRAAEWGRSLPPGFDAWFARCVVRDRNARFPNARAAYQVLAPVLRGGAPVAIAPSGASIVRGDGQYAPTADAIPAIVPPMRPSPQYAQQVAHAATLVATQPPTQPRLALAAIFVVLLLLAGVVAAFVFVVRPALEAASLKTASLADAGALVVTTTPIPTTPPATTVPPMPSDPGSVFGDIFDGGLAPFKMPQGAGMHFGGFIQSSDTRLQDDAEKQFNDTLAGKFDECLAAHPPASPSGSIPVVAHVGVDGSVSKVDAVSMSPGPLAPCIKEIIKASHFAAPKRATEVTFALFWMKN